jgi:HlyD family secretion protein
MKRKKMIILLVVVLLIGAGTFLYFRLHKKTATVTYQTGQVTKGTLVSSVSGSGNISVASSANINPSISGTVADLKVAVGDVVKQGQTLFTITNPDLDVTVGKAYTTLLQAQQKSTQAQADLTTAKQAYNDAKKGAVVKAQLAYDQAAQALAQAKLQREQDQATLTKYQNENTSTAGTHSDYEINAAKQKITADSATIASKESDVVSAQSDLTKAKAGTSTDITDAKTKVDSATINVQAAENDVKSAQLDYANQQKTAAERTVTAPIDGTVTTVNIANGDELSNSNNSSSTTNTPIVIQDLTSLKAVVSINEVDIASVKVGQTSSMTFDAVSGLTLTGKVEKVDSTGTSTQGVVSYSATVGFDSLDTKVKPEMSVNVTITTDVKQDVLIVASGAVKTSGTSHYVQILQNGSPIQQTVEIGSTNDTQTEITSGLSEGDSVITQTITASTSSTNTSSSPSEGGAQNFVGGGISGPGGIL